MRRHVVRSIGRRGLSLSVVLLPLVLAGCTSTVESEAVEFRIPVEVADVATGTIEDRIVTTGTLRTRERVVLNVETGGVLVVARDDAGRRLVEGATVQAGQLVAEITGEDARLAAGLAARKRQLDTTQEELESRRMLFADGIIAREEVRRAEVSYEDAKLAYEQSQRTDEKTRITTPIPGVIMELARDNGQPVADGQMVSPGFVVARIAPLDSLIADIDLVGPELARIRPGQPVDVRHYAFEGLSLRGSVLRLSPEMDAQTHTFRAEVQVDNAGRLLRPGMFIETSIIVERHVDVPLVPREAVTERSGRNVVFVVDGQRAAQRAVSLGLGDDEQVEVLDGVAPGARLVVRGLETLTDGTRVRVVGAP